MDDLTPNERAAFTKITQLAADAWAVTNGTEGHPLDPKLISSLIYKRLWNNHLGFGYLWTARLPVEASILMRCGVEAAICLAALRVDPEAFIGLLKRDAAFSAKKQRAALVATGGEAAGADVDDFIATLTGGARPAPLVWADLAKAGSVPQLYEVYSVLSSTSSHVTGMSIVEGATGGKVMSDHRDDLIEMTKQRPVQMAGTTLLGVASHARTLGNVDLMNRAADLLGEVNQIQAGYL